MPKQDDSVQVVTLLSFLTVFGSQTMTSGWHLEQKVDENPRCQGIFPNGLCKILRTDPNSSHKRRIPDSTLLQSQNHKSHIGPEAQTLDAPLSLVKDYDHDGFRDPCSGVPGLKVSGQGLEMYSSK